MTDRDEMWINWERSLDKAGYKALIPAEEFLSSDLTEAWISIDMWIDAGVIVKKE